MVLGWLPKCAPTSNFLQRNHKCIDCLSSHTPTEIGDYYLWRVSYNNGNNRVSSSILVEPHKMTMDKEDHQLLSTKTETLKPISSPIPSLCAESSKRGSSQSMFLCTWKQASLIINSYSSPKGSQIMAFETSHDLAWQTPCKCHSKSFPPTVHRRIVLTKSWPYTINSCQTQ